MELKLQIDEQLREELLAMAKEDTSVREELAANGSLFDGYHPRMEEIHKRNAARLSAIIEKRGWPGRSIAGEDGENAAWIIAQHDIGEPAFQRRSLELIKEAAGKGEAPLWQPAYLEDRIRMMEGREQLYGTQYDWDEKGEMNPYPLIEDPERVDERRKAVGLGTLAENTREMRERVAKSNEKPPKDFAERRKEMDKWARAAGWRD